MRSVVVTGASTGIGRATAKVLVGRGMRVFGSVRKQADGERVQAELGERFTPLHFDVTDEAAVAAAAARVGEALGGETLFGLVNNAGIAVAGPLLHLPVDEFRRQLEVNVVGQLIVTKAFLPLLGTDRTRQGAPGRIVNVSSVSGRLAVPFLGPYAASKHALEGLSTALRRELLLYGIDVIVVAPGAVATPIWDKAEEMDASAYLDTEYRPFLEKFQALFLKHGRNGYPPERVGEVIHEALTAVKPRPRYPVVKDKLTNWTIPLALPPRLLDRLIGGQLGLLRK